MCGKLVIERAPLQKAPNKIYGSRGRKSLLLPALLLDSPLELGFMFDCPVKYSPVDLPCFYDTITSSQVRQTILLKLL